MCRLIRICVEEFYKAARGLADAYKAVKEVDERTMETLIALLGRFK